MVLKKKQFKKLKTKDQSNLYNSVTKGKELQRLYQNAQ
jgi:hypothetical protein